MTGISFCVITDLRRPEKLAACAASIERLAVPRCEVLLSLDLPRTGKLGKLRNQAAARAQYDTLIVADDDILFRGDFYAGLCASGDDFDVLAPTLLNPDGTRHWDWMTYGGPTGHHLLDYTTPDDGHVYPAGGLVIVKRAVWQQVPWSEAIGFQEGRGEDVEWGERLHKAGYMIQHSPYTVATHDDPRYTQVGSVVIRR